MKNLKLFSIITAALALASCSREVAPDIDQAAVQFHPAIAASRAAGTQWTAGDQVGIFMVEAGEALAAGNIVKEADNRLYTITNTTTSALTAAAGQGIKYPSLGEVDFIAYYPYKTPLAGYIYPVDVSVQTTPANIDLLWAKTTGKTKSRDAVLLEFSHKLSKVRIDIVAGEGMQDSDFVGMEVTIGGVPATANFSIADGATFSNLSTATTLTLPGVTASTDMAATYEALLIPQAAGTAHKVTLTLACGTYYTFDIPTTAGFVSGTVSTFTVTLTATDVTEVVTKISPWADGTLPGGDLDFGIDEQAMVVDWMGHAGLVKYIEVAGTDGNTYAGQVDSKGLVTGIYALPTAVSSIKIVIQGRTSPINLVPGQFTYTSTTGVIAINNGAGTSASTPYLVANAEDLVYIRSNVTKHFIQVCDIDLANYPIWQPIGVGGGSVNGRFSGSYDGDGYVIDNMTMNTSGNYIGLFGSVYGGTLKNITIGAGSSVKGGQYVGAVCGMNQGYIFNCVNWCDVEGSAYTGGVAGNNNFVSSTTEKCVNYGDVTSAGYCLGGVCGGGGTYIDCRNYGNIDGGAGSYYVGGVSGNASSVTGCTNSGNVFCGWADRSSYTGGVCGRSLGNVFNSTNFGDVASPGGYVGGICGYIYSGYTIDGCTNEGDISCTYNRDNYVAGVCGYNNNSTIIRCHNSGTVSANFSFAGGVCGYNVGSDARLERCSNDGYVVTTNQNATFIGGVCANTNLSSIVIACINRGRVESAGSYVGGVCGGTANSAKVLGCINEGKVSTSVTGNNELGGVLGYNQGGTLTACINRGEVAGAGAYVGGVCGWNHYSEGTTNASYSTGKVTSAIGAQYIHFVAYSTGKVNYNYWTPAANSTATSGSNLSATGNSAFGAAPAWPTNDAAKNWGLFTNQTSTPVDNGYYWKSLGGWNGGTPVYPTLWWE